MKKNLIMLLLMLCPLAAMAQFEKTHSGYRQWDIVGNVHAGATASLIQGANADPLIRPTGGVGIELMTLDNLSVTFEMNYHYLGATNRTVTQTFEDGTQDRVNAKIWMSYLDTEYHCRWYLFKGVAVYTGLSFGTLLYCKAHSNDGTRHANLRGDSKKGRLSIPFGIQKNLGRFFVDARGYYHVNKVPDDYRARVFMGDNAHVNNVQLTIGYRFQLL